MPANSSSQVDPRLRKAECKHQQIAATLLTTQEEVAKTVGLGRDDVLRRDRFRTDKTQRRLREMVEIINKVTPRFGSPLMAYAWYRTEPLAGFAGQTAMQLSLTGRSAEVPERRPG